MLIVFFVFAQVGVYLLKLISAFITQLIQLDSKARDYYHTCIHIIIIQIFNPD